MAALSGWLVPRGTRVEVNRDAYVQPEPLVRAQTAQIYNAIRDEDRHPGHGGRGDPGRGTTEHSNAARRAVRMTTIVEPTRARGEPWIRKAGELVGVNFPDRTIELIVIPYEHEITVPHPIKRDGGLVKEVITRGAFDGIQRRANRIRCNREHDKTLTFGRVAAFHAGHEQGLHAVIRVAHTPLGEETLSLADDGCLDASAGFWPELDDRGRLAGLQLGQPEPLPDRQSLPRPRRPRLRRRVRREGRGDRRPRRRGHRHSDRADRHAGARQPDHEDLA